MALLVQGRKRINTKSKIAMGLEQAVELAKGNTEGARVTQIEVNDSYCTQKGIEALADAEKNFDDWKPIEMVPVESSNIESVGYDKKKNELYVEFKNGSTYKYFELPSSLHAQMLAADSKGGFLNKEIKGKFKFEKVR